MKHASTCYHDINPQQQIIKKSDIFQYITRLKFLNWLLRPPSVFSSESICKEMKKSNKEAVWFMKGIMDECTHLKNFSVPVDTSLVIAVCAKCDGYVPREGCSNLQDLWPGATIRYVDSGHVGAYIWYRRVFRFVF